MHTDKEWSLERFAKLAKMSRSGLALTFRKKIGVAPMVYLLNWRMQIACELLKTGDQAIANIATVVGYGSESAFSNAFYKVIKCRLVPTEKPPRRQVGPACGFLMRQAWRRPFRVLLSRLVGSNWSYFDLTRSA